MIKEYLRPLTEADVEALGPNWQRKLDTLVDETIAASATALNGETVAARLKGLMSIANVTTAPGLQRAYARKYSAISLSHVRFNLTTLIKSGEVVRCGHGTYKRVG